jgi:hypothetical protein
VAFLRELFVAHCLIRRFGKWAQLNRHREAAVRAADHLRLLLIHHGLLPHQDPNLTAEVPHAAGA